MNDDELLQLLRTADPMPPDREVVPPTSPEARQLLEDIMAIDTTETEQQTPTPDVGPRRRGWYAAAAAVVALLAGVGIWRATADEPADRRTDRAAAPLELTLSPFDPATSMCMAFDPAQLTGAQLAFSGRVTALADGKVTVTVEDRFTGDVPDTVTLDAGSSPALDGVAFEQGSTYLIAASDGVVAGCGSSGPDDPALRAAYEQVFG